MAHENIKYQQVHEMHQQVDIFGHKGWRYLLKNPFYKPNSILSHPMYQVTLIMKYCRRCNPKIRYEDHSFMFGDGVTTSVQEEVHEESWKLTSASVKRFIVNHLTTEKYV